MEKILFIVPPCITFNDFIYPSYNVKAVRNNGRAYGNVVTGMPLGLLSISSYVKKHACVETKLVDFTIILNKLKKFEDSTFDDFFREYLSQTEFLNFNPTIIGISVLFAPSYQNFLDIIKFCYSIFTKAIVIAGGGVPQNTYLNIFKEIPKLDAICFGEGEKPMLGLLTAKDKQIYFENSPSWITKNEVKHTQFQHDFVEDLDEIPFYDYDLCNLEDYAINPGYDGRSKATSGATGNFSVMTSRGCPHKCTFCASHTVHGRKMRYHSVDRVTQDFKRFKEKYGAETLVFQDDNFMENNKRAHELIRKMGALGLTAVFQNGLNLYALDWTMLKLISDLGVKQLTLPVESGSKRVLQKIMKKPLNLRIVKRVVDDCRRLGIYTNVSIIIGMPGEKKKDIEDAKLFFKELNANWIGFLIATPLAGSEMFRVCVDNNYIVGDYINTDYKKAIIETEDFTPDYIRKTAYSLNLELNFVENSDFRLGEYETALIGFENAIEAKSDHAFAHYYSGKCYEKFGNPEKAKEHLRTAKVIINEQPFWRKYCDMFSIVIPD